MSSRTMRRGTMLSRSTVTSASSRPTRPAISAAVSGVRVSALATRASSGVNTSFRSFISSPEGVRVNPEGSASIASASRS